MAIALLREECGWLGKAQLREQQSLHQLQSIWLFSKGREAVLSILPPQ